MVTLLAIKTAGPDIPEIYQLLRKLADAGASILFYSTDYDELIGCCDRVLVLYDGRIVRELAGEEMTEHALIASALNVERAPKLEARGTLMGLGIFILMFAIYIANHPAGFSADVVQTAANKGVLLAFVVIVSVGVPVMNLLIPATSAFHLSDYAVSLIANYSLPLSTTGAVRITSVPSKTRN
eukprot:gene1110-1500_t